MAGVQGFEPWNAEIKNPVPYHLAIPQLNSVFKTSAIADVSKNGTGRET